MMLGSSTISFHSAWHGWEDLGLWWRFIRRCKQGCLQFVILKPILVVITFILYAKGKYEDGNFSVNQSYLYITIIYTISYSMALYALALFYAACRDLLRPYNPVPKFIIIKSVVFLTYWQGVLVFLAAKSRFIKNAEKAADLQNYVLCVEMLIAAIGHTRSMQETTFLFTVPCPYLGLIGSILMQFAPTYNEYVLYNHNEGESAPTKFPSGSAVPSVRDVELAGIIVMPPSNNSPVTSSVSSNHVDQDESMTTPIRNKVDPPGGMYDLTDLLDVDLSSYPAKVPAISDSFPIEEGGFIHDCTAAVPRPLSPYSLTNRVQCCELKEKTQQVYMCLNSLGRRVLDDVIELIGDIAAGSVPLEIVTEVVGAVRLFHFNIPVKELLYDVGCVDWIYNCADFYVSEVLNSRPLHHREVC
ncbi:hypothetical protein TRIUR3_22381 [Triticum urartu]|uniref:Uncharacterized protein n=1 Tax=Triticum urartu TaxID=4572 RepID=M8A6V9_TRIUA|nr:hypothetical protein TRIUR3_22381 [Triticum urartu]